MFLFVQCTKVHIMIYNQTRCFPKKKRKISLHFKSVSDLLIFVSKYLFRQWATSIPQAWIHNYSNFSNFLCTDVFSVCADILQLCAHFFLVCTCTDTHTAYREHWRAAQKILDCRNRTFKGLIAANKNKNKQEVNFL